MKAFSVRKIRILSLMMVSAFDDESYDSLDKRSDKEIEELFTKHCGSRNTAKAQLAVFKKRAGRKFLENVMPKVSLKFRIKYKVADTQPEANLVEGSVREAVFSTIERLGVATKLVINSEYGEKCGNIVDTLVKHGYVEALPESEAEPEEAEEAQAEEKPAKKPRKKKAEAEAEAAE